MLGGLYHWHLLAHTYPPSSCTVSSGRTGLAENSLNLVAWILNHLQVSRYLAVSEAHDLGLISSLRIRCLSSAQQALEVFG